MSDDVYHFSAGCGFFVSRLFHIERTLDMFLPKHFKSFFYFFLKTFTLKNYKYWVLTYAWWLHNYSQIPLRINKVRNCLSTHVASFSDTVCVIKDNKKHVWFCPSTKNWNGGPLIATLPLTTVLTGAYKILYGFLSAVKMKVSIIGLLVPSVKHHRKIL